MVFNTASNIPTWTDPQDDIVSDCYFWTGANSVSYKIADIVRNCNRALDRAVQLIMKSDKEWTWDDTNNTDFPIATTTLVAAQHDYSLAVTHLNILKVRILDANGYYYTISPINRRDIPDSVFDENDGLPRMYAKMGNSILLYPAPAAGNVTMAKGLEIQMQRPASYFTTADTTKTPGFASQFHRLVPLYAASDYCSINNLTTRLASITREINRLEAELVRFYELRSGKDTGNSLGMGGIVFK